MIRSAMLCDTMLRARLGCGKLDTLRLDGPTCDAELCDGHASTVVMRGHGDGGSWADTIDACPYCQASSCPQLLNFLLVVAGGHCGVD